MDLNAHAAGLNFNFIEGEQLDYLFNLTDWAGKEEIDLTGAQVYGTVAGIRDEERWELEVEDVPDSSKKILTFPQLKPGRYVYELWVEWADENRNRLLTGAVTMEKSVTRWEEVAKPPVTRREINVRVSSGQEGTLKAYILAPGFVAACALRAEAAAKAADMSAAESKASELVAQAAQEVTQKAQAIVDAAKGDVQKLQEDAAASAASAAGSAVAAAGSAAAAQASEDAARTSAEAAAMSAQEAGSAASAAKVSEEDAAASAASAKEDAERIEGDVDDAAASAAAAAGSAAGAAGSAAAAKTSEQKAQASATTAQEAEGKASYELWKENGHPEGTVEEYLEELRGRSAYEIWLANGHEGSEDDFLKSLKGKDGLNSREEMDKVYAQITDMDEAFAAVDEAVEGKSAKEDVYKEKVTQFAECDGDGDVRYAQYSEAYATPGRVKEVTLAVRATESYYMAKEPVYLGIWESDGQGGWEKAGVSQEAVLLTVGRDATWSFNAGTVLHGRPIRFAPVLSATAEWPGDAEWEAIGTLGVRIKARNEGDTWTCCMSRNGIVTNYVAQATVRYVSEEPRFAPIEHTQDAVAHVTQQEREKWNGKTDDTEFQKHTQDAVAHVTQQERESWNAKVEATELAKKADAATLTTHMNDKVAHVTTAERNAWNAKVTSTVGKVTDVQYYAAGKAPALANRTAGVLYLVGQ